MLMLRLCLLLAFVALTAALNKTNTHKDGFRQSRLNMYSVVKFPNVICSGDNNREGTCYAEQECSNRGGTGSGTCADGYGVCCTFILGCGDKASENVTYFESTGSEFRFCKSRICSVNKKICQIRLDFDTFVIRQPSTSTEMSSRLIAGVPVQGGSNYVSNTGQCNADSFSVASPGVRVPSPICGTNTGEHMYVDVHSGGCIDLLFTLGIDSALPRSWSIKVSQYDCSYDNLAPSGCTKYYFGSPFGMIKSYNFDSELHLADQKDIMCIRRERGQCRICYVAAEDRDFEVSGKVASGGVAATESRCCAYGYSGQSYHYDCVIIPGASKISGMSTLLNFDKFCGAGGLITTSTGAPRTVCSKVTPFKVVFISDNFEFFGSEDLSKNKGVKLTYVQTSC